MPESQWDVIVIGGGAAGFFGAISAAEHFPRLRILIMESSRHTLHKVRISGGGRCNVTHACFDPKELVRYYPRGEKALLSPFLRFGPTETQEWFLRHGVRLKKESDGRMFPVTDRAETIASCLEQAASTAGIDVQLSTRLIGMSFKEKDIYPFKCHTHTETFSAKKILISTGSCPGMWKLLESLGLSIVSQVPSLFTFHVRHPALTNLSGISVSNAAVRIAQQKNMPDQTGPLLITHWGLSGPVILRSSAWGARILAEMDYQFEVVVNWTGISQKDMYAWLLEKKHTSKKTICIDRHPAIPSRLWERLVSLSGIVDDHRWADTPNTLLMNLSLQCCQLTLPVSGKSPFKEEFVTAGGVDLKEIDFRTFGVKKYPGMHMAGEILDIDAITGGFNFQNAWTGGWIAGQAIAEGLKETEYK